MLQQKKTRKQHGVINSTINNWQKLCPPTPVLQHILIWRRYADYQSTEKSSDIPELRTVRCVRVRLLLYLHSPVLLFGLQENHCEMRISLNQKPNSSKDFGFEAAWDSTGARVTSVQPGNDRGSKERSERVWTAVVLFSVSYSAKLSLSVNLPLGYSTELILDAAAQARLYILHWGSAGWSSAVLQTYVGQLYVGQICRAWVSPSKEIFFPCVSCYFVWPLIYFKRPPLINKWCKLMFIHYTQEACVEIFPG